MEITHVKVITVEGDERLKAFITVEFDGVLVIRDLKIIGGDRGLFVAMPSKKLKDGTFKDIVYAAGTGLREALEKRVVEEYQKEIERQHSEVA